MSITRLAISIPRKAASMTASGRPTKVTTVRFVAWPGSTFSRRDPIDGANGVGDLLDDGRVAALRKVRHAFDQRRHVRNMASHRLPRMAEPARVFLLSPASTAGKRAQLLLNEKASFDLATRVRNATGAPLGEVFSFLSGLYFRGKLGYARTFARPAGAVQVITSDRGLVSPERSITVDDLRAMSAGSIDHGHEPYRTPLMRDAQALHMSLGRGGQVILLGSIATEKYVAVLSEVFGSQLFFPLDFVGRGDMSRGGLMLRSVREGRELDYARVMNAVRRGARPGKPG